MQGWTHDGAAVVFASSRATWAPSPAPRFWTVPAAGGVETPMALPRAFQGRISPDGTRVAYRVNSSWDDERRNYRGGQNRPVWIVDLKTYDLVTPPWTDSKDIEPVWVGNAVYFLSDRDGVSNVWSYDLGTKKLTQVTTFTDFDVKTIDGRSDAVVFEQAGYIHELDPKTGRAHVVNIRVLGDFPWMMPRWDDVTSRMTNIALSPTGKRVVVEARGEIFTIPAEKGDTRNLTHSSGTAERNPAWSRDGKWVSYFSDSVGRVRAGDRIAGRHHAAARDRDQEREALLHAVVVARLEEDPLHRHRLQRVGGRCRHGPAEADRDGSVGRPAARGATVVEPRLEVGRVRGAAQLAVPRDLRRQRRDRREDAGHRWPRRRDVPGVGRERKYLWFLASTDLGLGSQWLDMTSYDREETFGLYLAVLKKGEASPLLPESDEDKGAPVETPRAAACACARCRAVSATGRRHRHGARAWSIDFDGLQQRILAVGGVPERQYSELRAGLRGPCSTSRRPMPGSGARGNTLHRYKLSDRKTAPFVSNVAEYDVSADGKKLLYRTPAPGGGPGGLRPPPAAPTAGRRSSSSMPTRPRRPRARASSTCRCA